MDISFSDQDLQFQEEIRAGLNGSEYPAHVREKRDKGIALSKQDMIDFHKFIHSKGWMGYNWPVEYGGTGWSPVQIYLFLNELALAQCPTILPFGVSMVGPVIYTFGNQEQKDRFLPDILEFNTWWCQGYSEPGSGSDLASLKTKAVLDGDHYIVNGSKTWTTLAQNADWIFCLVRTETTQKKQEGISFLLIDMNSPGIEVKPIITIDGDHEVNSVFFTDVKVPADQLIGEEGKGFDVAGEWLVPGRVMVAANCCGKARRALEFSLDWAANREQFGQTIGRFQGVSFKLADMETELQAAEWLTYDAAWRLDQGTLGDADAAMAKLYASEMLGRVADEAIQIHGGMGMMSDYPVGRLWRDARIERIWEGTSEIQRHIISRSVLRPLETS